MITPIIRLAATPLACLRNSVFAYALGALLAVVARADDAALGLFRGHTDIGKVARAGTVAFDAAAGAYDVAGAGENMWFRNDSFHYVWQEVSGDVAIEADISFPQTGGNNHRKGVLMFRQSLDADSAYVDVAVHGDGLTSLQFREAKGDLTHEVQCLDQAPRRVRLEKIGDYVFLSLPGKPAAEQVTGSSARVFFKAPFYVGIGVCAHDDKAFETVRFTRVAVGQPAAGVARLRHTVEYVKVPSGDRVCVAPVAAADQTLAWEGKGTLIHSAGGPSAATPASAPSPDGKWQARFEHQGDVAVLTLHPAAGGEPRVLMRLPDQRDTPTTIAWSPDGTKIAYVRTVPR